MRTIALLYFVCSTAFSSELTLIDLSKVKGVITTDLIYIDRKDIKVIFEDELNEIQLHLKNHQQIKQGNIFRILKTDGGTTSGG